jgi:hypothetical protein
MLLKKMPLLPASGGTAQVVRGKSTKKNGKEQDRAG